MSISTPTTTPGSSAANATVLHHQTFWCHECDMSVLLLCHLSPGAAAASHSTFPPLCPHCRHDFLEQMDSFTPPPNSAASDSTPFYHTLTPMDPANPFPLPSTAPSDDTFLLDSPYFHRLVNHLVTPANAAATTTNNIPTNPLQFNSPASKSAIESLHQITVDSAFLQKDPAMVCPVCKDQFFIDSVANMLPCKHAYHAECVVPWLEINNSCPVCRYRLPSECDVKKNEAQGSEAFIGAERLDELFEDDQELLGFRSILRNVVRRHQQNRNDSEEHDRNVENWNRRVVWDNEVLFSPTQIGEAVSSGDARRGDHVQRANSVETVSSWPRWTVDGGPSGHEIGDGDIGASVNGGGGVGEGGS